MSSFLTFSAFKSNGSYLLTNLRQKGIYFICSFNFFFLSSDLRLVVVLEIVYFLF